MTRQPVHRWWLQWSEMAPWIAVSSVGFTIHWAAGSIMEYVNALPHGGHVSLWLMVVYMVLFVASLRWLYSLRRVLFRPRTRFLRNEAPEKRAHLILFLSNLNAVEDTLDNGVPKQITLSGDLDKDLAALVVWKQQTGQRWPWEMCLRSIRHHLGALKTLTVICSPESITQVHWFGQMLACYDVLQKMTVRIFVHKNGEPPRLIKCPETVTTQGGWDFEQFDALSEAVSQLLHEFRHQGITDEQIMIDFTGGQKVTSVVATSMTFNRTIKAQYVQTNPDYNVISYDIVFGLSETGGLGL